MEKPPDPYEVLGVDRGASAADLKKAYRRRALETHPDRKGDPVEFQKVRRAYWVLSDPARRARFDETGEVDEPNQHDSMVLGMVVNAFRAVVGGLMDQGAKPEQYDLVGLMAEQLGKLKLAGAEAAETFKKATAVFKRLKGRFQRKKPEDGEGNFLEDMVARELKDMEDRAKVVEEEAKLLDRAIAIVRGFSYKADKKEAEVRLYKTLKLNLNTSATGTSW